MKATTNVTSLIGFLCCLSLLLSTEAGNCTCDVSEISHDHKATTIKYRVGAIGAILGAGAIGVGLPLLGTRVPALRPENDIFFMIKAFAAGVILATGYIHILPEAFKSLTSPCLPQSPWGDFPFAGFIAMIASVGSLMVESLATGHSKRVHFGAKDNKKNKVVDEEEEGEHASHVHVHTHATHGHAHGGALVVEGGERAEELSKVELIRHQITAKVLELGVIVHSLVIGISLGASQSLDTIKPLMAALCFHQFFEGMGLGGCISQAKFKNRTVATMALCFSLTTPVGIGIGMAISGGYVENSPKALIIQGIFESMSAGILIYMALVDLLAADFMNPRMQGNTRIQLGSHISLLLGAGCMSVLAKWA